MSEISSRLTQRVTFQSQTQTDDGYGGKTIAWVDFATVFAEVQPVYANWAEQEVAGRPEARAGYRVITRTRTDINGSMRILWKTHRLNIHSLHEAGEVTSILTYEEGI